MVAPEVVSGWCEESPAASTLFSLSGWHLFPSSVSLGFLLCPWVFNTCRTNLEQCEVWSLGVYLCPGLDVACEASYEVINSCLGTLVTRL